MTETDQKLVERVLGGNLDALTILFGRYERAVLRYAVSIVGNVDDADDVVQDAFIKAYRNLRTYQCDRPFRPWLYRIIRNEALNWRRKHHRIVTGQAATLFLEQQVDSNPSPHQLIERQELQHQMRRSLSLLPLDYREPLILYYVDERSYAEISDILRLPVNTVATRIRRGKDRLKAAYEAETGKTNAK